MNQDINKIEDESRLEMSGNDVAGKLDQDTQPKITALNFSVVLILAIVILLALAAFLGGINNLNRTEVAEGIQEVRLSTTSGDLIMQYKIYEKDGKKVLVIVSNRIEEDITVSNLITNIVYSENLAFADIEIMLIDSSDINGLTIEQYFGQIENNKDPTNLLSNLSDSNPNLYFGEETIEPVDFKLYIGSIQYSDDRFSITEVESNSYRVELKNNYTEEKFRSEFLSQFLNTDNLIFTFVDRNDLRLQNP